MSRQSGLGASVYGASPKILADMSPLQSLPRRGLSSKMRPGDPRRRFRAAAVPRSIGVRAARECDQSVPFRTPATLEPECCCVAIMMRCVESVRRLQASLRRGRTCYLHPAPHPTASKRSLTRFGPKPSNVLVIRDSGFASATCGALSWRRTVSAARWPLAAWTVSRAQERKSSSRKGVSQAVASLVSLNPDINGIVL